jgi:hypothetical protein
MCPQCKGIFAIQLAGSERHHGGRELLLTTSIKPRVALDFFRRFSCSSSDLI